MDTLEKIKKINEHAHQQLLIDRMLSVIAPIRMKQLTDEMENIYYRSAKLPPFTPTRVTAADLVATGRKMLEDWK